MVTDIIPDYDEKTVDEVHESLADSEFTADELDRILTYEQEHEARKTLVEPLSERLAAARDDTAETDAEEAAVAEPAAPVTRDDPDGDDAAIETEANAPDEAAIADVAADDAVVVDTGASATPASSESDPAQAVPNPTDLERIAVTPTRSHYAAGIWFDDMGDIKEVEYTQRIENALESGLLEEAVMRRSKRD